MNTEDLRLELVKIVTRLYETRGHEFTFNDIVSKCKLLEKYILNSPFNENQ